jgi:hypothetical protein
MTTRAPGRPRFVPVVVAIAAIAAVAAVAGCSASATLQPAFPPVGFTPAPVGVATAATRAAVTNALSVEGLQVVDAPVAYRPAEGPLFAAAPRSVIQVILPADPAHGFITLYSFGSPQAALTAANDQAAYIASGPGRVQFGIDARFNLRVLASTAIFFWWSPANSPDEHTPAIDLALGQVGTAVPMPGLGF